MTRRKHRGPTNPDRLVRALRAHLRTARAGVDLPSGRDHRSQPGAGGAKTEPEWWRGPVGPSPGACGDRRHAMFPPAHHEERNTPRPARSGRGLVPARGATPSPPSSQWLPESAPGAGSVWLLRRPAHPPSTAAGRRLHPPSARRGPVAGWGRTRDRGLGRSGCALTRYRLRIVVAGRGVPWSTLITSTDGLFQLGSSRVALRRVADHWLNLLHHRAEIYVGLRCLELRVVRKKIKFVLDVVYRA